MKKPQRSPFKYMAIPVDFDEALVEAIAVSDLPPDWTEEPLPTSTKEIGDRWARESLSAVLEVPSVIVQTEANYLLNPTHPDFEKIAIGDPRPFSFDPRLL